MQSSNQEILLQIKSLLSSVQSTDAAVVPSAQTIQTETSQTDATIAQSAVSEETTMTQTDLSKKEKFSKILEFFWNLPNSEALIEKIFSEQITVDIIFELWDLSISLDLQTNNGKCLDFFCENYNKLTTDEFIKRINFRIICLISGSEKLNLEEYKIFSLVTKWIKLTNPDDTAKKEVLSNIRLPLIKPNFLAEDVKQSGLFSESELLEAFYHQASPTKRTELRFQERHGCDSEIYLGSNSESYPDYRKILNKDIITKGFRKSLIASLKKNNDKLEFIGQKEPNCRGVTTENSFIFANNIKICANATKNIKSDRFFKLDECDIEHIYNESCSLAVSAGLDSGERYNFFVKKYITFDQ